MDVPVACWRFTCSRVVQPQHSQVHCARHRGLTGETCPSRAWLLSLSTGADSWAFSATSLGFPIIFPILCYEAAASLGTGTGGGIFSSARLTKHIFPRAERTFAVVQEYLCLLRECVDPDQKALACMLSICWRWQPETVRGLTKSVFRM